MFINLKIQQTKGMLVGSSVFFLLGYGGHRSRRIHSGLHSRRIPLGMMTRACDRNKTALERGTGRTQPWSRKEVAGLAVARQQSERSMKEVHCLYLDRRGSSQFSALDGLVQRLCVKVLATLTPPLALHPLQTRQ